MYCLFCGFEVGTAGSIDPCDAVLAFEDHLAEHVEEMALSAPVPPGDTRL